MRRIVAASLVAICGVFAGLPARADWVPAVKGNDTGGSPSTTAPPTARW